LNKFVEAEQAVIGNIIIDSDKTFPLIASELSEDDFYVSEYKTAYKVFLEMYKEKKPIDFVTALAMLGNEYKEVLYVSAQSVPSIKNCSAYVKIVKEHSQKAKAKSKALELIEGIDVDNEIPVCLELSNEISKCFNVTNENCIGSFSGWISFIKRMSEPIDYIRTGISTLDKYTYISKGDYIVIGARPSAGKTALTLQLLLNISKKHNCVYFSLETSTEKIFERLAANLSETNMSTIKRRDLSDDKLVEIANLSEEVNDRNFTIIQASGWSVDQIKSKSIQLGAEVIFVDYIGLIAGTGNSQYEKATKISNDLHTMAQKYSIAVIALSQLNREGKGSPDMTHLRDSGAVEQDADIILLLDRDEKKDGERKLIVAKNKDGGTGIIEFFFRGEIQKFIEKDCTK